MNYLTEPLELSPKFGTPLILASWTPHELNAKHPILNTDEWGFTGTRYLSKPVNYTGDLSGYDPWFRPFRKWCMDERVWTKDEGRGPHDWISDGEGNFYRFTTVEQKHIMLWCE